MRQHPDVTGCPVTLAVGLNGMCHLNAAIPSLEEQPSLGRVARAQRVRPWNESSGTNLPLQWGWRAERGHGHKEMNFPQSTHV